jgi:thiol:disulfide interchange protein DsbC
MMQKTTLAIAILATVSATAAMAGVNEVEKKLKEKYPATNFVSVRESPVNGIYEVVTGRNIAYTDEDARYMIFGGHIYDMHEQKDLTAERLSEINRIDVTKLPLEDAIKTTKGDGSRTLYVFTDPDCPFCQRLERETFTEINNVTIYTFLYPMESLHPGAQKKSAAIWCAEDKSKAWREFIDNGTIPSTACQSTSIDRNIRLGSELNINGTPTIILGDGRIVAGFVPAKKLEQMMGEQ